MYLKVRGQCWASATTAAHLMCLSIHSFIHFWARVSRGPCWLWAHHRQQLWGIDSLPRVGSSDQSQVLGPLNHLTGLSFRTQGHLTKDLSFPPWAFRHVIWCGIGWFWTTDQGLELSVHAPTSSSLRIFRKSRKEKSLFYKNTCCGLSPGVYALEVWYPGW